MLHREKAFTKYDDRLRAPLLPATTASNRMSTVCSHKINDSLSKFFMSELFKLGLVISALRFLTLSCIVTNKLRVKEEELFN